jgi:AcrR family transcriptional regulator
MAAGQGREAQRRRTRRAIVDAATALLAAGRSPSVDEIAAAAEVSRRTVYLHFPTYDQLVLDATLGALTAAEGPLTESWDAADPAPDRVAGLVDAVLDKAPETLPLGRQIVRLTVAADGPPRGQRRLRWIEAALEPTRAELTAEQYGRLSAALAVLIGFESMIAMRDVVGADAATEARTIGWAARVLVDAMRAEAEAEAPGVKTDSIG